MTGSRDDLPERVGRAMYEALVRARPAVELAEDHYRALLLESDAQDAADVLEGVDAAIADAAELFGVGGVLRAENRGGPA